MATRSDTIWVHIASGALTRRLLQQEAQRVLADIEMLRGAGSAGVDLVVEPPSE